MKLLIKYTKIEIKYIREGKDENSTCLPGISGHLLEF